MTKKKRTKEQLEWDLSQVENNIEAADKNIKIFSDQIETQMQNKVEFEQMKKELQEKISRMS